MTTSTPRVARTGHAILTAVVATLLVVTSCSSTAERRVAGIAARNPGVGTFLGGSYHLQPDVSRNGLLVGPVRILDDGRIVGWQLHDGDERPWELVVRQSVTATDNLASYRGLELAELRPAHRVILPVADRWIVLIGPGRAFWWDLENPDVLSETRFWPVTPISDAAPLGPSHVRLPSNVHCTHVIDLETGFVRDVQPADFGHLEARLPGIPDWGHYHRDARWVRASSGGRTYVFDDTLTTFAIIDAVGSPDHPVVDHEVLLDGSRFWITAPGPAGRADIGIAGAHAIHVAHPRSGFQIVTFELREDDALRRALEGASAVGITADGRLVLAHHDGLVVWTAGRGPSSAHPPPAGGHPIDLLYTLDDGRILAVSARGDLTTWDVSGPTPVPTLQFSPDPTGPDHPGSIGPEGPVSIEITDGNIVVMTMAPNRDDQHRTQELEIVQLTD